MSRCLISGILCRTSFVPLRRAFSLSTRCFKKAETDAHDPNEPDRTFAPSFTRHHIPKEKITMSFSRSSGAGGQHVNKVSTKVDMRFIIDDATWLPLWVKKNLKEQEYNRINKKGELVMTSQLTRSQLKNIDDCLEKLHAVIIRAAHVPAETDEDTKKRVEKMMKEEKERAKLAKVMRTSKKEGRRKEWDD